MSKSAGNSRSSNAEADDNPPLRSNSASIHLQQIDTTSVTTSSTTSSDSSSSSSSSSSSENDSSDPSPEKPLFYSLNKIQENEDKVYFSSNESRQILSPYQQYMTHSLHVKSIKQNNVNRIHKITKKDFEKKQLIGRGNTGRVYLVQNKHSKEYYSMKVIDKMKITDRNKQQRIESEKEILKQIVHPFIVKLFHSFQTPFYHMYVMTYCPGGDFRRLLNKQPGKCFRENIARFYLAEVVCALEYLHMKGIVYRDLKPENILLTESGHIMLSDFDLAKSSNNEECTYQTDENNDYQIDENCEGVMNPHIKRNVEMNTSMKKEENHLRIKTSLFGDDEIVVEPNNFRSNSFVGTNEYLAPEIISQNGHSASVDWWTLGVLMYEFLYGSNPFSAPTIQETYENIQQGIFTFPKTPRYKVSRDARDMIKELLDVDSEDRLGSQNGAIEIKQHEFFASVKFALIRNEKPPIIPNLRDEGDTSWFDEFQKYDDDVPDDWGREMELKRRREKHLRHGKKRGDGRRKRKLKKEVIQVDGNEV